MVLRTAYVQKPQPRVKQKLPKRLQQRMDALTSRLQRFMKRFRKVTETALLRNNDLLPIQNGIDARVKRVPPPRF